MQKIKKLLTPKVKGKDVTNPEALLAIRTAAIGAAAVAVTPIPFTDATLLIPTQTAMIVQLYRVYDQSITEGIIKGILSSLATTTIARGVVGNIVKFVPVIGTVTGGAINATVAVAFTNSMGKAVAKALEAGRIENPGDLKSVLLAALNFKRMQQIK